MNKDGPFTAIINVSVSIYPVDPTGELNGRMVDRGTLKESGIRHKIIKVNGNSYEECAEALREKLNGIN